MCWTIPSRKVIDKASGSLPGATLCGSCPAASGPRTTTIPTRARRALFRLAGALAKVSPAPELVLVDCPPSLGQLTRSALTAADRAVLVTEPSLFAVTGVQRALEAVQTERLAHRPALQPLGVVINRFRPRVTEHEYRLAELRDSVRALGAHPCPTGPFGGAAGPGGRNSHPSVANRRRPRSRPEFRRSAGTAAALRRVRRFVAEPAPASAGQRPLHQIEEGSNLPHHVVGLPRASPNAADLPPPPDVWPNPRRRMRPTRKTRVPPGRSAPRRCLDAHERASPWPPAPQPPRAAPPDGPPRTGPRPHRLESRDPARGRHRPAGPGPPAESAAPELADPARRPLPEFLTLHRSYSFSPPLPARRCRWAAVRCHPAFRARPAMARGDDPVERVTDSVPNKSARRRCPDSRAATATGSRCEVAEPDVAPCRARIRD